MENLNQRSPLLSWAYFCQEKAMEELRHSLLYTTLELEQTRMEVQEELRKRDDRCIQLRDILSKTIKERDEAEEKCQRLLLENLLLHQHQQQAVAAVAAPFSVISSIEDDPRRGTDSGNGFSSSDCDESIVSSPILDHPQLPPPQPQVVQPPLPQPTIELVPNKPLPEKGKLLQAVMKAGPLLQTLLLAGPLPQWRHPPPPLESFEIPPVTIPSPSQPPSQLLPQDALAPISAYNGLTNCGRVKGKRVLYDGGDCLH